MIASATLPDASFNQAYSRALAASGGSGMGYAWRVVGGALPPGLSLSATGLLSGTPTSGGTFGFQVGVTDSELHSATIGLVLHVKRSRYLAFTALALDATSTLRLVDVTRADFPVQDLGANRAAGEGSVVTFRVSPDGRFIAYAVRVSGPPSTTHIRLVDLSAEVPSDSLLNPLAGDRFTNVVALSWAPDSRTLVSVDVSSTGAARLDYVDLGAFPATPVDDASFRAIGGTLASTRLAWAGPQVVIYSNDFAQISYARRGVTAFGAPRSIADTGNAYRASAGQQAIWVAPAGQLRCFNGAHRYPLTGAAGVAYPDGTLAAPGLDRVAIPFVAGAGSILEIFPALDQSPTALVTSVGAACDLAAWAPSGSAVGWADGARYQLTRLAADGSAASVPVPGTDYGSVAEAPRFSPDSRYLAYRADGRLSVARVDSTTPGAARPVGVVPAGLKWSYEFAANSRALLFPAATDASALHADLEVLDLSVAGAAPRVLSPPIDPVSGDSPFFFTTSSDLPEYDQPPAASWSSDSTKLAYFMGHRASKEQSAAWAFYLYDLSDSRLVPLITANSNLPELGVAPAFQPPF